MADSPNENPGKYALLIGVDCYLPNRLPDGSHYPSLGGCVRDVSQVEAFLRRTQDLPPGHILKLTASNSDGPEPREAREQWPTYQNMVAAFKRLTDIGQPGDNVYIHYSGHGGRASTAYPSLKGANGLDEALVPTDIGNSEARYLRDLELAKLLGDMVKKGLIVAVVLDSCHSGGMTRGTANVAVRGITAIDTTPRPLGSLVASQEELANFWRDLAGGERRNVKPGSGWLPEPKGYVLLAACRPSESAYESAFDGSERNGALTYWFLDSLKDAGPGYSYKLLHDRIVAKVHSQFENQTPQLQGEGDRAVFGTDRVQPHYAVPVMQVDELNGQLLLNAGQAQGLRKGAQLAVYPRATMDFTILEKRLALIEVSELGATDSWAKITKKFRPEPIEPGAQAVLLGAGSVSLVRKVSLVQQKLPLSVDQDAALQAVQQALTGSGWIEVARQGEQVSYQVAVNELGEYEIWDVSGRLISNLRPALNIGGPQAASVVVSRLVHLAKFYALKELYNHDSTSPLVRKLVVELIGKRVEYDPADPFEPEPFDDAGHTRNLKVGEWAGLRIKNDSLGVLNVTVFDLQPGWGAKQIYPSGEGDYFVAFDPGEAKVIPLRAYLPENYREGTDTLKVFATVGTTNFRWLELPPLDQPLTRSRSVLRRNPGNPLEEMLAAFTADRAPTRDLNPAAYPSKDWITEAVELRMHKP